MSITPPGVEVAGPACVPPRFGLLSVAEVEDMSDGHWIAGIHHEQEPCGDIDSQIVVCTSGPGAVKDTEGAGLDFPESDPFTLVAPFKCATGGLTLSRAWDLAGDRLSRGEARAIERAFWTGLDAAGNPIRTSLGQNPDVADITPAGGALSITDGVALLESWAGQMMPCAPILHASRGLATYMAERNLVASSGQLMYAAGTGSRVAVGGGYLATGPNGVAAAAGEAWLFVTGSIKILRGPVFYTPDRGDTAAAVDRVVNDVTVFAERVVGVAVDCAIAAVRVRIVSCCCVPSDG